MTTHTKGNIIIENIKVGDIMWECEYGTCLKVEVLTLPKLEDGQYTWQAKNVETGKVIDYLITVGMSHYAHALYDYEAYIKIPN